MDPRTKGCNQASADSKHYLVSKLRQDIYSFAVNTINIVIECNENINLNVFITRDENFYDIHRKKVNFLFILLFTRQCAFLTS